MHNFEDLITSTRKRDNAPVDEAGALSRIRSGHLHRRRHNGVDAAPERFAERRALPLDANQRPIVRVAHLSDNWTLISVKGQGAAQINVQLSE